MTRTRQPLDRRSFLKASAAGIAAFGAGIQLMIPRDAKAAAKVVIKYDWLMSKLMVPFALFRKSRKSASDELSKQSQCFYNNNSYSKIMSNVKLPNP